MPELSRVIKELPGPPEVLLSAPAVPVHFAKAEHRLSGAPPRGIPVILHGLAGVQGDSLAPLMHLPERESASGQPKATALRNSLIASPGSRGTPFPSRYMVPRWYLAASSKGLSAAFLYQLSAPAGSSLTPVPQHYMLPISTMASAMP